MLRRGLKTVGLGLLALVAILFGRAALLTSSVVAVAAAPPLAVAPGAIERFAGALRLQTISHQDQAQMDGVPFTALHAYLEQQFPLVHQHLSRETVEGLSLLYTWQGSDPKRAPIVLLSHLDVVPVEPGTDTLWQHPPFAGVVADGFLWGRGAMDDKIGVLGILEAAESLLRQGFQPQATIYFAFGHDEELGGPHGAPNLAALLKQRGVHADFVLDEGGSLIKGILPGLDRPVACVGVAEKGYVSVELTVESDGGHSSSPPRHTAIGQLSQVIARLEDHPMPGGVRGPVREFLNRIGPEMGFGYRIVFANLWLFEPVVALAMGTNPAANATLRTTTAVTMVEGGVKDNVLPKSARAVVNFRILPGESVDSVVAHVKQVVADDKVKIRILPGPREPTPSSPTDSTAFAGIDRTIRSVFPQAVVAPYLTIGGTDARHYLEVSPNVYRFMPMVADPSDLNRTHGTNERLAVEQYDKVVQFYATILRLSSPSPAG